MVYKLAELVKNASVPANIVMGEEVIGVEKGEISEYASSVSKDNRLYFLDTLKGHIPNFVGTLKPKPVANLHEKAQWLSGIAAGAWYELHATENSLEYWYKRISPHGNIDVHALYEVNEEGFDYHESYDFIHYSNCKFFHSNFVGSGSIFIVSDKV